ncbi:MAG: hypothetical protein WCX65_07685, partial [bacterium]
RFAVDNAGAAWASGTVVQSNGYMNFGPAAGAGGYGFRDNGGTIQFKYNAGAWANIPNGSGYVLKAGDTMTGALTVNDAITAIGNITTATGTVTAANLVGNGAGITGITATDSSKVAKTGGTMTGPLYVGFDTATASLHIKNAGGGNAVYINNSGNTAATSSVYVLTNNSNINSVGIKVYNTGIGRGGYFLNNNVANTQPAVSGETTGTGYAVWGVTNGSGYAVAGNQNGTGSAGYFHIGNAGSSAPALIAETLGTGRLIQLMQNGNTLFDVDNSGNMWASGTVIKASGYMNFGTIAGISGYGLRDNGGNIEVKDSLGGWTQISTLGGAGAYIPLSGGTMTGGLAMNFNTATSTLKITNTGAGYALAASGTVTIGSNTGTDGYDVSFYGTSAGAAPEGRMFWDASKDAFRAGRDDTGTYWNDANTGQYSFAVGLNAKASGVQSQAIGPYTVASNTAATAIGNTTTATALSAVAMGSYSNASGNESLALGRVVNAGPAANTVAIGQGVSLGNPLVNNTASSMMVGFNSTVPTLFVGPASGIGTYGKVGIGTTTPTERLGVNGYVGADGAAITAGGYVNFGAATGTTGYGFHDNAGTLEFKNNAGVWATIPSGGNYVLKAGDTMTGALSISSAAAATISATNNGGTGKAVSGTSSAAGGVGVYGNSTSSGGAGVYGTSAFSYGVRGDNTHATSGTAGYFNNTNAGNTASTLTANTVGTGSLIELQKSGTNKFLVDNSGNVYASGSITTVFNTANVNALSLNGSNSNGIYVNNAGTQGKAAQFLVSSGGNNNYSLTSTNAGPGGAALFQKTGGFVATPTVYITSSTANAESSGVYSLHTGTGAAAVFQVSNVANATNTVLITTNSTSAGGIGLKVDNSGTGGQAAYFMNSSAGNTNPVMEVYNTGGGNAAARFQSTTVANATGVIYITTNSNQANSSLIMGNHTGTTGNLMKLQATGVDKFVVTRTGAVTATSFTGIGTGLTGITATDATKVAKTGDTMTGPLYMSFNTATATLHIKNTGNGNAVYIDNIGNTVATSSLYVKTNNTSAFSDAIRGEATGAGRGVFGTASGAGAGVLGYNVSGGYAVEAQSAGTSTALFASSNGSGNAVHAYMTGSGIAGNFQINNAANTTNALQATTNGTGNAGSFTNLNNANTSAGLYVSTNSDSAGGHAIQGYTSGSGGRAGYFQVNNAANTSDAVYASTNGAGGRAVYGITTGDGSAAAFQVNNAANISPALISTTNGTGNAGNFTVTNAGSSASAVYGTTVGTGYGGYFMVNNAANANDAMYATTNGTGAAVKGYTTGNGNAIDGSSTGSGSALSAYTSGAGNAGYFQIDNAASANSAIYVTTNGTSEAIKGLTTGTGIAGYFQINNNTSAASAVSAMTDGSGDAIYARTTGAGRPGYFEISNVANANTAITAITNGTGQAIYGYTDSSTANAAYFAVNNGLNSNNAVTISTNSNTAGGKGLRVTNSGTGDLAAFFEITAAGNASSILLANTAGTGNLLQMQQAGADKFVVNNAGDITVGASNLKPQRWVNTIGTATWSAAGFNDLPNGVINATTRGGDLLVTLNLSVLNTSGANTIANIQILLDGTPYTGSLRRASVAVGESATITSTIIMTGVAGGAHTIKGQINNTGAVTSLFSNGDEGQLTIVELPN